jgi:hypothetical protein
MASSALIENSTESGTFSIHSTGDISGITLEGKDAAIGLRQWLVRRGIHCSFPAPTWQGANYQFFAKRPAGLSGEALEAMIRQHLGTL